MVSKTRKRKQQKGGAIHKLPSEVAPTTGAKVSTLIENFFTNNALYYVDGHGALLDATYIVPENTYIFHAGVSGKTISSQYCKYEKKYIGENDIMDLVQKDNKEELWKLLTGQPNASSVSMYSPKTFEPEKTNLAIYEPGDEVHDMMLNFSSAGSANLAFVMAGVYKVPVRESLFTSMGNLQLEKTSKIGLYRESDEAKKVSSEEREKKETEIATQFANEHDDTFRKDKDNLLKAYFQRDLSSKRESIRHTITESNMVYDEDLFPTPPSGVRIFIVWACRAPYDASTKEERETKAKTMRRKSINVRKYNESAIETYIKAEEEKRKARLLTQFREHVKEGKPVTLTKEAENFIQKVKEKQNRKTRRNQTWRNLNKYIVEGDETVLPSIKVLLTPEELKELKQINTIQSRKKKNAYAEVLKKLKRRLLDEEYENNANA